VLKATPAFELAAENLLNDGLMASPVVHAKSLLLRTKTHPYRIEAN